MSTWLRYTLFSLAMLSCVVIGARLYLGIQDSNAISEDLATGAQIAPEYLPEFSLRDLSGEPQSIRKWAGQPLIINFWATWCAPCLREMPLLQTLHLESAQTGVQVIGIAIDRQSDVQQFITESGISYPILWGEGDAIAVSDLLGVPSGLPFTVLVTANGEILTLYVGELERDQFATMVETAQAVQNGTTTIAAAQDSLRTL